MKYDSSATFVATARNCFQTAPKGFFRQSVVAALVAGMLTGCAALKNPESIKLDIPANTSDFSNRLYAGASMGSSHLSPSTRGPGFSVSSDGDTGTQLRLGYDVHNMLAVELDTSVLGAATLRNENTGLENADVKYSSASVSALVYGWSGVQMRSRRQGLSAYGRFGFSALSKSSAVVDLEESGVVPILGIGAEYGFVNGLGIRADITRFDSDATYVGFGAIYRFGISPRGISRMIADAAEPALSSQSTKAVKRGENSGYETVVERYAGPGARPGRAVAPHLHYTSGAEPDQRYVGSMADRWRPAMRADDRDSDGVLDNVDSCPDTERFVTVDGYGCGLFDAVLHDVTFKSGSRWLTPRARGQLDKLAETLLVFPESRIQVRAHTDSQGAADMNLGLSSRRAEVVVQYLQSRGVHELQLQAVGMGEAQPLDTNTSKKGRMRNRRIDVVTLPDQDAGQLLIASNVESGTVMSIQSTARGNAGSHLVSDEWNSRKEAATVDATQAPELMAANPVSAEKMSKIRALANKVKAPVAPKVVPLPQPGFAPAFQVSGVLENVRFEKAQSELTDDSQQALQPLLNELNRNPAVKVAVMAHTDNQGSIEDNKLLSSQRAQSVVEYLVSEGVDPARLKAEGYGELLPLVQNVTESDRQRNRRIEIRVMPVE